MASELPLSQRCKQKLQLKYPTAVHRCVLASKHTTDHSFHFDFPQVFEVDGTEMVVVGFNLRTLKTRKNPWKKSKRKR